MKTCNTLSIVAGLVICIAITACESPPTLSVTSIDNPSPPESKLPNLTRQGDGVILSWVKTNHLEQAASSTDQPAGEEPRTLTHSLEMSTYKTTTGWNQPSTVAEGAHWFVNWADFPSVYAVDNTHLAAHWLKRSGQSTYAYDVVTSQSTDGINWSDPQTPHTDGTKTEHGFASFFKVDNQATLAWLDGRNTDSTSGGHADHSGASADRAMTLRTRTLLNPSIKIDGDKNIASADTSLSTRSTLIDDRVCDCCQTTAVNTDLGAIVFYRNRSADDIRDIAYVRYDQNSQTWSEPKSVYNDEWKITGCPVNGPQAVADGRFVAVTWFTAAPTPRVQIAVSTDSGASFGPPVIISESEPLGRVALVTLKNSTPRGGNQLLISWLERSGLETASLETILFDANLNRIAKTQIAQISAARQSGFPRMAALSSTAAMITWTDWANQKSSIRTAQIDIR